MNAEYMTLHKEDETDYLFWVNDTVVGECSISFKENLYIEWIEVYEAYRKHGYIRDMLKELFKNFNVDRIEFYCKPSLVKMYEHLGAVILEVVDSRGASEMLLMRNCLR